MKSLSIRLKRSGMESKNSKFFFSFENENNATIFTNNVSISKAWNEFSNYGQELLAGKVDGKVFLPDKSLRPTLVYKDGKKYLKLSQFGKGFCEMNSLKSSKKLLEIELFPRGKIQIQGFSVQFFIAFYIGNVDY